MKLTEAKSLDNFRLFLRFDDGVSGMSMAGFHLLEQDDVTENTVLVSERWHKDALLKLEGEERFAGCNNSSTPCITSAMKDDYQESYTSSKSPPTEPASCL